LIKKFSGLACAPLWALSSILLKTQTNKLDALRINAIRGIFASLFLVAIVPVFGKTEQFNHISLSSVIYLWSSVIIGIVMGDTLYIKGMTIIGVSRALPISIIYPVFVLPFSIIIAGDRPSALVIVGMFVIVLGLYFITSSQQGTDKSLGITRKQYWWGVFLVLAAALLWAIGTTVLDFAMKALDTFIAGAIRMPFMTAVLWIAIMLRGGPPSKWHHNFKSVSHHGSALLLSYID